MNLRGFILSQVVLSTFLISKEYLQNYFIHHFVLAAIFIVKNLKVIFNLVFVQVFSKNK